MFIFHVKRNSEQDLYYWSVDEKREKCCSCVARTRSLLAISSFIEQLLKHYMCCFSLSSGYSGLFLVLQRIHMLIGKVDLLAGRWNLESCPPMPVLITLFLWPRASRGRKFASFGIFGWYSIGLICSCGYFIPIHFPPLGFLVLLVHLICTRGAPIWSPSLHIFAHQNKGGKQNKNKVDFLLRRMNLVFAH